MKNLIFVSKINDIQTISEKFKNKCYFFFSVMHIWD